MKILVDTNILGRLVEPGHPMHAESRDTVKALFARGHVLCLVPQNCYEFWVIVTRPTANNGLGLSAPAARELANVRNVFPMLDETPAVLHEWEHLVTTYAVTGKTAHDAHLAGAMLAHGVTHLLTFNDQHFRRFAGITALTPAAVIANPSLP